jgi:uncharacterized protein (TIGR00369 family)
MQLLPNYAGCFVCGHANPQGLAVRFWREGDAVVGRFVPEVEHEGYRGRVHGGVLSALLDEVMAWAPSVRIGRFCVAAEITVRFVRPAPLGAPLHVRGEMTADRGRLCDTRAEIRDEAGALIARATGRYAPISAEETAEIVRSLSSDGQPATLAEILAGNGEEEP